jgi:hypothetical protein
LLLLKGLQCRLDLELLLTVGILRLLLLALMMLLHQRFRSERRGSLEDLLLEELLGGCRLGIRQSIRNPRAFIADTKMTMSTKTNTVMMITSSQVSMTGSGGLLPTTGGRCICQEKC